MGPASQPAVDGNGDAGIRQADGKPLRFNGWRAGGRPDQPSAGSGLCSAHAAAPGAPVSPLRIWLVGFGTVGRWLAGALDAQAGQLAARYGRELTVVGIGNARDGFVYHA